MFAGFLSNMDPISIYVNWIFNISFKNSKKLFLLKIERKISILCDFFNSNSKKARRVGVFPIEFIFL